MKQDENAVKQETDKNCNKTLGVATLGKPRHRWKNGVKYTLRK